jgi:hypothetical protein
VFSLAVAGAAAWAGIKLAASKPKATTRPSIRRTIVNALLRWGLHHELVNSGAPIVTPRLLLFNNQRASEIQIERKFGQ